MVEDLIEALETSKIEYEGRSLDFEIVFRIASNSQRDGPIRLFSRFSCILISGTAFNIKSHNETDHKRKIETSCMFHV